MNKLILTVLPCALFLFLGCFSQVSVSSVDIVRYGLYNEVEIVAERDSSGDEALITDKLKEIKQQILKITDELEPEKGVMFGVEFIINGKPLGAEAELEIVHVHPEMTNEKGEKFSSQRYKVIKKIGEVYHSLYMFESDYELVKGNWTIQIYYNGKKKAEKVFSLK